MTREDAQMKLRIPRDLRERIKESARLRNRSMNAEIVRALRKEFPEPWDLDVQITYLLDLFGALQKVRGDAGAIEGLFATVLETVQGIADGRVPDLDAESRRRVKEALDEFNERVTEDQHLRETWYDHDDDPFPDPEDDK